MLLLVVACYQVSYEFGFLEIYGLILSDVFLMSLSISLAFDEHLSDYHISGQCSPRNKDN